MAASAALKVALAASLVTTLGLKLVFGGGVGIPISAQVSREVADHLATQGFQIRSQGEFGGRPATVLTAPGCELAVMNIAHQGWHEPTLREAMPSGYNLFFIYDGKAIEGTQPKWLPLLEYYVLKAVSYTGWSAPFKPMLAVVARPSCDFSGVDWTALPTFSFHRISLMPGRS